MKSNILRSLLLLAAIAVQTVQAAPFMPPRPFIGGIPGKAQFQAILMQRHQARTLLYREALEELHKNPKAADVPDCPAGKVPSGVLCLAIAQPVAAQPAAVPPAVTPAVKPQAPAAPVAEPETALAKTEKALEAKRKIAVLFGINKYNDPIPELGTPIADVKGIADILKSRYGYDTRVYENVGKAGIVEALNALAAEAKPDDSVLLFYAGHGYEMDDTKMGFWIPSDASVRTAANWISNSDISKLLAAIKANQLILVSDSCFSGTLTKEQKVTSEVSNLGNVLQKRSVMAFSSGGEEPVSDGGKDGHSIFAWNFINTLESAKGLAPGYQIYHIVHGQVMKDFPQEPQYGAVISAGHTSGGEYIFDSTVQ